MGNNFLAYLQQLELMIFFSGYPLLYAITFVIITNKQSKSFIRKKAVSLLPFSYALVGTLYIGLQLKNLYPDYSSEHIRLSLQQPFFIIWGFLSVLFWIPVIGKRSILTLVHSLVIFCFLLKDLFSQFFLSSADKSILLNDMQIYTFSLVLNLAAFSFIILVSYLAGIYKTLINKF